MKGQRVRCSFCGASADDTPEEAAAAMENCNNCQIDVKLKGQWTGIAWAIINAIRARKGMELLK